MDTGLIVGLCVLGVVLLKAWAIAIWFLYRKLRERKAALRDRSRSTCMSGFPPGIRDLENVKCFDHEDHVRHATFCAAPAASSFYLEFPKTDTRRNDIIAAPAASSFYLEFPKTDTRRNYISAAAPAASSCFLKFPKTDTRRGRGRHVSKHIQLKLASALSDLDAGKVNEGGEAYETNISPVMELNIDKEVVFRYGKTPVICQVIMTAQSYYRKQTLKSEVSPVECIQVMDQQGNVKLARSTVFTADWMQGTPTSLLMQGSARSFENVFSHANGLFAHITIGPLGGQLTISGVNLTIPADALSKETLITLGVTWDSKYTPTLSRKQCLLSPVVLCQPSGLTFKVPVELSFPHAADKVTENWKTIVLKREGDIHEESVWSTATPDDYQEKLVTETQIKLSLNHFTLYTCMGESKPGKVAAKLMHVVAYAGKLKRNAIFKPRLYCINSYKEELTDVENLEGKMEPYSKMLETTELLVKDNEEDVVVEMAKLTDEWRLAGDKHETLPFELVWHACHPHCSFVLKPKTTSVTDVMCEIHTYQRGNENNQSKLKIAEELAPSSPLSPLEEGCPLDRLTAELAILLDPTQNTTGDWRTLAEKMGCDLARIRWLSSVTRSPTQMLIDKWVQGSGSLKELEQHMVDIDRLDAAEEVRKYMEMIEAQFGTTV